MYAKSGVSEWVRGWGLGGDGTEPSQNTTTYISTYKISIKLDCGRVRAGTPHRLARAGRGLLVREVSPTGAPRPSCCCAPLGARVKSKRIGPGRQSEPAAAWDSDCELSNWSGVISGAAGGACSLCLWSFAALVSPGYRGRRVRSRVPRWLTSHFFFNFFFFNGQDEERKRSHSV